MELEIRVPDSNEMRTLLQTLETAFGYQPTDDELERWPRVLEPQRMLVTMDGKDMVGVAGAIRFDLSVPGNDIPVAGVTTVGVLPSHRRRGVLSQMMRRQLQDVHAWNESIAVLWASEGSIYQRYGYGLATRQVTIDLERDRAQFLDLSEPRGRTRLIDVAEAEKVLPGVYDHARTQRAGMPSRSLEWWRSHRLPDPEADRHGAGPMWRVVLEVDGSPVAYALYRVHGGWEEAMPSGHLAVLEVVATSPLATREIWRYLFGIDLVARIKAECEPIETPLQHLIPEMRRLRLSLKDGVWLRVVELRGALEARAYAADGSLEFRLIDELCEWNDGTWRLEVCSGAGAVSPSDSDPELVLRARDLGATYLGGTSFGELALAGRIEELSEGAVDRADSLFRASPAPWCPEIF